MSIHTQFTTKSDNHGEVTAYGHDNGAQSISVSLHTNHDPVATQVYKTLAEAYPDKVDNFERGAANPFSTVQVTLNGIQFTFFGEYLGQKVDENQMSLLED